MNSLLQPLSRPLACALALGVMAICAWKFGRGPLAEVVTEYRESRHWQQVMVQAQARAVDLEVDIDQQRARQQGKQRIARDLIEGRLALNDAGRQYGALPGAPLGFQDHLRATESGASDHERVCRHLIDYACAFVESEAARQELRARLMKDLENSLPHSRQPAPPVGQSP